MRAPAARVEPKLMPESFRFVRDFLQHQAGIALAESKEYFAAARLSALAEELGLDGVESLVASLRREPAGKLAERTVDELTINETSFFRDAVCFDLLVERLMPALMTAARPCKRLRVWSAACSTGEEPYSVAMLLRTRFPELATWNLEILGTDISRRVLKKAAEGLYSAREIGRGLPRELLERWFVAEGKHWRVCDAIRALVSFQQLNLQKPFPALEPFDLVFLRNVLIYFDDATKREVLLRLTRLMRPGGVLVLGSADALRDTSLPLRALHCEPLVAYTVT
jgi:chemotaxis protein methyltransferase CheR